MATAFIGLGFINDIVHPEGKIPYTADPVAEGRHRRDGKSLWRSGTKRMVDGSVTPETDLSTQGLDPEVLKTRV